MEAFVSLDYHFYKPVIRPNSKQYGNRYDIEAGLCNFHVSRGRPTPARLPEYCRSIFLLCQL
ncbi:MAG: hypothetical protein ACO3MW_02925, partial [Rhodospirillales bacterium]